MRRNLAAADNYITNDIEMISQAKANDAPSKIKMCNGDLANTAVDKDDAAYTVPLLAGYQMSYGTGSNQIDGPAHGDVRNNCQIYSFPSAAA